VLAKPSDGFMLAARAGSRFAAAEQLRKPAHRP
jgi:hypothetical protein